MKIVLAVMLLIFCIYESASLIRSIPKWRAEALVKKQAKEKANKSDTNEDVGNSDVNK